jgi:hypothetical protein
LFADTPSRGPRPRDGDKRSEPGILHWLSGSFVPTALDETLMGHAVRSSRD